MSGSRYNAEITAGSLKVRESRVIAELLLRGVDATKWAAALYEQNALQARSVATAKRLAELIRKRLQTMDPDLWRLVSHGSAIVATHACLAAAIKHSALLGDFMDLVVREQHRMFATALTDAHWRDFIEGCHARDPEMPEWSQSTIERLRSSVFQILAQGGYIESTRTLRLQTNHIAREVLSYLQDHNEHYVLRCIQVNP